MFSRCSGVEYRAMLERTDDLGKGVKEMAENMQTLKIDGKEVELLAEFPVRFACMEHVEEELDDYVNEFEAAPNTYRAESVEAAASADAAGKELDKRCRVCGEPGQIALMREKGM